MNGSRRRLAVTALVAASVLGGCDQFKRGMRDAARDQAAASVDALPADSVLGQLRTDFPADFAKLRAQVSSLAADGLGRPAVEDASRRFMIAFNAAHEGDVERAPDAELLQLAKGELQLLQAAHAIGDAACVAVWAGGGLPAFDGAPPAFQTAVTEFGRARIHAARTGIDTPTSRGPASPLDPADRADMLALASRSGASAEEIAEGAKGTPEVRCRSGLAIRTAVTRLPPPQAARAEAYFMHSETIAAPG